MPDPTPNTEELWTDCEFFANRWVYEHLKGREIDLDGIAHLLAAEVQFVLVPFRQRIAELEAALASADLGLAVGRTELDKAHARLSAVRAVLTSAKDDNIYEQQPLIAELDEALGP